MEDAGQVTAEPTESERAPRRDGRTATAGPRRTCAAGQREGGSRRAAFHEERDQYRLLFRAFLQRLFESDLFPDTVDPRLLAVWLAAALAGPPAFFAVRLWTLYGPGMTDADLVLASVPHKLFFIGYSMAVSGLLTVLVWDALFPRPARRRRPRRPARAHGHRRRGEAGRADRVRRRLRRGREHPGLRALPAGRRRPAPGRRRRPLPARALRRHRLRRRPGVPGPRLGAGGPGPRPAPAAPAAGVDARAAPVRGPADRVALLRPRPAARARRRRSGRDARGAGGGGRPVSVPRAAGQPRRGPAAAGVVTPTRLRGWTSGCSATRSAGASALRRWPHASLSPSRTAGAGWPLPPHCSTTTRSSRRSGS